MKAKKFLLGALAMALVLSGCNMNNTTKGGLIGGAGGGALGAAIGADTAIGEKYLPMHLPVIFVGLLIGAYTGSLTGLIAPLVSFALTGMPAKPMLPFMMIELFGYGFAAGIIKNIINTEEVGAVKSLVGNAIKVFLVQVSGRALRAIAILFSFHVLGNKAIKPIIITKSISAGVVGIVIQLVAIPILLFSRDNNGGTRVRCYN